jgi:hypothetical protein
MYGGNAIRWPDSTQSKEGHKQAVREHNFLIRGFDLNSQLLGICSAVILNRKPFNDGELHDNESEG